MNKVLVTGGGGFVGSAIVRQLSSMGVETTVIGRHHYSAVEDAGAQSLVGDICDLDFLKQAAKGYDVVFHVAAKAGIWGSRDSYYAVNVQGTENVIEACLANGIRTLVHTSTPSVVFDGNEIQGGNESLPYSSNPLCHYAETKILAEKKVLAANSEQLRTASLRPHLIWGPGDTQIIPRLIQRGRQGKLKIVGDGRNLVDISYIDNIADAHILAAENLTTVATAAGQAFFISQGEPVVLWDWINELFNRVAISPVNKRVSFGAAYKAGRIMEWLYSLLQLQGEPQMTRFLAEQLAKSHWFSIDKANRTFSYSPKISTSVGMDRLVKWLRQQDNLK